MLRTLSYQILVGGIVVCATTLAAAQDVTTSATPFRATGARRNPSSMKCLPDSKVRQELARPTNVELSEAPLSDVVEYFKDAHAIEIQFDIRALEDAQVATDTPVTVNLHGVSLGRTLQLILARMGLVALPENELLVITSERTAKQSIDVRIYDCDWAAENQIAELMNAIELLANDHGPTTQGVRTTDGGQADIVATEPPSCFEIKRFNSSLIIRASAWEHARVEQLLSELRDLSTVSTTTTIDFGSPGPVQISNRPLLAEDPVQPNDELQARWGNSWWAVRVLEALPGGEVRVHYKGWGPEWDETLPRTRLQKAR